MDVGAITEYVDVAQVVLYVFWVFFFGLIIYLHQEAKREGYPLEKDRWDAPGLKKIEGFPPVPEAKTFRLPSGAIKYAPDPAQQEYRVAAEPTEAFPGAPLEPTGNPMTDGVGPAAYALRKQEPERLPDGEPKIVPLRSAAEMYVSPNDTDPRGMEVRGYDGNAAGTCQDVWVDQGEHLIRYLEVEITGGKRVLLPMTFARVNCGRDPHIEVNAITAEQFSGVPALSNRDSVTLREEDQITGYYGGGTLYGDPRRAEPIL
ncbi:MAG: photosynthetic reaction center subunit H [Gammaproteobacteria bacterium]|nr:photosynthetic reaction center subunit H [Gammaproteobacteria bacterium]